MSDQNLTNTRAPTVLWVRGMLAEWFIAGVAVTVTAVPAVDVYLHDTEFPFGPLRFAMLASTVFGSFAALYYCWPKLSRRALDARLAKVHFWGTIVFFNLTTLPMLLVAAGVQQLRLPDPRLLPIGAPFLGRLAILGLCGLAFYQLPFVWALILSLVNVNRPSADSLEQDGAASASAPRTR